MVGVRQVDSTNRSVLVTGGAGYVGAYLVHKLDRAGHRVVVLDNLSTGETRRLAEHIPFYRMDIHQSDDLAKTLARHKVDTVIHAAANTSIAKSIADPRATIYDNIEGTRSLLTAMEGSYVRHLIFSSSAAVYGAPVAIPVSEDAPCLPLSPYGASKLEGETMIRAALSNRAVTYALLRYFNVAGADPENEIGQRLDASDLITRACGAAKGLVPDFCIYGDKYPSIDGTAVRDFIHLKDLGQIHLGVLEALWAGGKSMVLNCGSGTPITVRQVVDILARVTGQSIIYEFAENRDGDIPIMVADTTQLVAKFPCSRALMTMEDILTDALVWTSKGLSDIS